MVGGPLRTGVRLVVERRVIEPPWRYEGEAHTSGSRFRLVATLHPDGLVVVELPADHLSGLATKVRLILRAAWRHTLAENTLPPRKIARWRADG